MFFVKRSRELGFSLEEVRELLELVDGGEYTCAEIRQLPLDHSGQLRKKVRDLRKLERVLRDIAAACDDDEIPDCPIIDVLFGSPVSNSGRRTTGNRATNNVRQTI